MQAVQYAIDQNLAPVVSTSYGLCELETSSSDAAAFRSWAYSRIAARSSFVNPPSFFLDALPPVLLAGSGVRLGPANLPEALFSDICASDPSAYRRTSSD